MVHQGFAKWFDNFTMIKVTYLLGIVELLWQAVGQSAASDFWWISHVWGCYKYFTFSTSATVEIFLSYLRCWVHPLADYKSRAEINRHKLWLFEPTCPYLMYKKIGISIHPNKPTCKYFPIPWSRGLIIGFPGRVCSGAASIGIGSR